MANSNNSGKGGLRHCSFCGRNENQVNFLIPSPTGAYICDFCVDACNELKVFSDVHVEIQRVVFR